MNNKIEILKGSIVSIFGQIMLPSIFIVYLHVCVGYSPGWRQLWAYNTHEIIGRGRIPRQLSQGCYMP